MKIESILSVVFITIITMGMVVFINLELSASSTGILTSTSISDHESTVSDGSIFYSNVKAVPTQNNVHIAWSEPTTTTFPYEEDVFYRQLPNGITINLSNSIETQGDAKTILVQPSTTTDDVCVLWQEETSSGDYFLFLWRSMSNTTKRLLSPVGSGSSVELLPFICNTAEDAQITWISPVDNEVYIWNEVSNTQRQLSD